MQTNYSKSQLFFLIALRLLVGWHILYEGIAKLLNPQWSSLGFLQESQWIMSGFAKWVISSQNILSTVDFLNTWGLIFIGLGLILGLFCRTAAISGAVLLIIYYLNSPPLTGLEYVLPADGSNLVVNKTLIEAAVLGALACFPVGRLMGLDGLIAVYTNKKKNGGSKQ